MKAPPRPLERPALAAALAASGVAALFALGGAAVRVLPWVLDPAVSWRVAMPFARSLGALAIEAALLVGWPVGWALAVVRLVERGEHRVWATLGERPERTVLRLAPQAAVLGALLAMVSYAGGRDASAPGRVVNELLAEARASCEADEIAERSVPFADASWLCAPGATPRLAGRGPGALAPVVFTASGAHVAGDLRQIDLADAEVMLGRGAAHVRAGRLTLRGLTPWAHASNLAPLARAALLALTAAVAAHLAAYLGLRRLVRRRLGAVAVGAAGPLAALGGLRTLERTQAHAAWSIVVLPLAILALLASAALLSRLPLRSAAASK